MDTALVGGIAFTIVVTLIGFGVAAFFLFRARNVGDGAFSASLGGRDFDASFGAALDALRGTKPKYPLVNSLTALSALPVNTPVSLTARVADSNPKSAETFVIFYLEEFRGMSQNDREQWVTVGDATPALLVELPDGPVQILNHDYEVNICTTINGSTSSSTSIEQINDQIRCKLTVSINGRTEMAQWDSVAGQGTLRYLGLESGDQILIDGTVELRTEGIALRAERVTGFRQRVSLLTTQPRQPNFG